MTSEWEPFERHARRNRLFVLGAGFSADAGIPMMAELLAEAMRKFGTECTGLYSRVERYGQECVGRSDCPLDLSALTLSGLCTYLEYIELREYGGGERWNANGSREKLALRFYLAKTIAERTPSPSAVPELYRSFAAQLHEHDMVVSLNWDGLLEVALASVGKAWTYNGDDKSAVKLTKLHGSVNWRLGEPNQWGRPSNTLGWRSLGFTKGMMETEIYYSPALLSFGAWHGYEPLGELDPFLVLPGYGKAYDVRANAALWYKPEFAFSGTYDVYLIGLSLAPDDFLVRSLFLSNLQYLDAYHGASGRRVFIINPDEQAPANYDFVLSGQHADLLPERFSRKHLDLMAQRLGDA